MCLIAFAWQAHARYRLVVAANRDELHARPTAPAAFWNDAPRVYAGRDLKDGGTWMGVTGSGRFAALTNFRDPNEFKAGAPSRGALVANFLREATLPHEYSQSLGAIQYMYNGFNLLVSDSDALWYVGNRSGAPRQVEPGVHSLSNALLDTPWPKSTGLQAVLAGALAAQPAGQADASNLIAALFGGLGDQRPAPDAELPQTGVGLERERQLAPRMIVNPVYGTRSATVLLMDYAGNLEMVERSFTPDGVISGTVFQKIPAAGL